MPNLLNQLQATSVRLVTPDNGVWFADVEATLDESGIMPSGKAVLTLGTTPCLCTIDPRASGAVGDTKASLRVLGGGGGWDKSVRALQLHNDAQVLSTALFSATAAEVGEVVVDVKPTPLGKDYLRSAGPASRVFAGREWWVSLQGITTVGPRPLLPYDPTSVEILSWDPRARVAELASDTPILPGTVLVDPTKWKGAITVRDVEQTWGDGGARAMAWCGEKPATRLAGALAALISETSGVVYLKTYRYRVVKHAPDGRLILQAISKSAGMPDALPISTWYGIPGVTAKLRPGSIVLVEFMGGEPSLPIVRSFESGAAIELSFDAISISAGTAAVPLAKSAPVVAWTALVSTALAALGQTVPPLEPTTASTATLRGA